MQLPVGSAGDMWAIALSRGWTIGAGDSIAIEEKFVRLPRREKVVDGVYHIGLRKKVFEQGGIVISSKVKCLLELGCKPPMSLIHDSLDFEKA